MMSLLRNLPYFFEYLDPLVIESFYIHTVTIETKVPLSAVTVSEFPVQCFGGYWQQQLCHSSSYAKGT